MEVKSKDTSESTSKLEKHLEGFIAKVSKSVEFVKDFAGGVSDFFVEYNAMQKENLAKSDKYFHSKANFKASRRGPGGEFAAEKMKRQA